MSAADNINWFRQEMADKTRLKLVHAESNSGVVAYFNNDAVTLTHITMTVQVVPRFGGKVCVFCNCAGRKCSLGTKTASIFTKRSLAFQVRRTTLRLIWCNYYKSLMDVNKFTQLQHKSSLLSMSVNNKRLNM